MSELVNLLASLEPERFESICAASPKRFREELFRRAGFKKKSATFSLKQGAGDTERLRKLQGALREGSIAGMTPEVIEELVRNYLYSHRGMLGDALDFLGISHEDGLTNQSLDFIGELPEERGRTLKESLLSKYDATDVALYLSLMGVPGV